VIRLAITIPLMLNTIITATTATPTMASHHRWHSYAPYRCISPPPSVFRTRVVTSCCHAMAAPALPPFLPILTPSPILTLTRPNTSLAVAVRVTTARYNGSGNCTLGVIRAAGDGSFNTTATLTLSPRTAFNFSSGGCWGGTVDGEACLTLRRLVYVRVRGTSW
jgi:hypothetical protein